MSQRTSPLATHLGRTRSWREVHGRPGGLAVEHGPTTQEDGTVVAGSFPTRLTTER